MVPPGYYKPPFCQWPFGGSSKKEAKQRLKGAREPVVKAGSYEYLGDDFYYGLNQWTKPKDEDEISIRTESTTLYLNSNVCTRTFGPNQVPNKLPGKVNRAKYIRRPHLKEWILPEELRNVGFFPIIFSRKLFKSKFFIPNSVG